MTILRLLAAALLVCSCSSTTTTPSGPPGPCAGTFKLTDTRTADTGGTCHADGLATQTATVVVGGPDGAYTWTEDGQVFAVKGVTSAPPVCEYQVSKTATSSGVTITVTRDMLIENGSAGAGSSHADVSGGGAPCTADFHTSGTK